MKPHRSKFALSVLISTAALFMTAHGLQAGTIYYAPYAPFSVTIDDASTAFNDSVSFNGSKASLGGSFGVTGLPGSGLNSISGTVIATFQADPGYVFTGVMLAFDQWSYSNAPFYGGHGGSGSWSVPGSTYVGDINPPDAGADSMSWQGSGSSGGFNYYRYVWWDGGGGQFQSIMGPFGTYPIQLNNVSSFTLTMNLNFWAINESGYGTSSLGVNTLITGAPPVSSVPEGAVQPQLLGAVFLGILLLGSRFKPRALTSG